MIRPLTCVYYKDEIELILLILTQYKSNKNCLYSAKWFILSLCVNARELEIDEYASILINYR